MKDLLYLTVLSDHHGNTHGYHHTIIEAHNKLVQELIALRSRVWQLEKDASDRDSRESKTD